VENQWYWIPEAVNTTPRYSPALVAFVSLNQNNIGWVPLGPGDPYVARYYDENWQPHYLTRDVVPGNLVNYSVPGAVTLVPIDYFGRPYDPRVVTRVNPQMLAQVRPTLDPLTLTPLRNAVLHSAWGRGKIDLPPGIAKKLGDTRVFVGTDIRESPFRKDLAKSMRVERVSDNARNQKLKWKDERNGEAAQQTDLERKRPGGAPAGEGARGNQDAGEQARGQQEKAPGRQQAQRSAVPPAQGVRVGHPAKSKEVTLPKTHVTHPELKSKAGAPESLKHQPKPQSQGAQKQERKQQGPSSSGGKGKHP
jgi:hypothetical protein